MDQKNIRCANSFKLINWTSEISLALSFRLKFMAENFQPIKCGLVVFAMSLFVLSFCLVLKEMDQEMVKRKKNTSKKERDGENLNALMNNKLKRETKSLSLD